MRSENPRRALAIGLLWAVGLVAVVPAPAAAGSGKAGGASTRDNTAADKRTRQHPTLDSLTGHTELERRPDGTVLWKRSFVRPIEWEEYLAALKAEGPIEYDLTGAVPVMRRQTPVPASPDDTALSTGSETAALSTGGGASLGTCTPPDDDYDGDSWTMTTSPTDQPPTRRGEYIADRPRVAANFTSYIEPGIDVFYTDTQTTVFEHNRFLETDLLAKTEVVETREMKKKFNSGFALKWVVARGALPIISMDLSFGGTAERNYEYKWTNTTTRTVEQKFTDIQKKYQESKITVGPTAGRVSGQVTMFNLSDYAIDVDVSNVRIAVVAYSPFAGGKYVLGDVALSGTWLLGYGSGNNSASSFVLLNSLNTLDMMRRLAEGQVFDMEMASYTATNHATGGSLTTIISHVNERNARISIHYGDSTPRQYGQISVFEPASACRIPKDLLTEFVGAGNVEFDRTPDGKLIIKRIFHRTNMFADRDFDTLTPAEQAQYGRWIVAYEYYNNRPDPPLDLETTLLHSEDKVYFYFVTAADFVQPPPAPDQTTTFAVANDGTGPASSLVTPVSTYDTVELSVTNAFTLESPYSQFVGNVSNPRCGTVIYQATWYGHQVTTDSRFNNITIPNVDWYGVQLDFGGQGWRTLASILADPAAKASVTQFRGFPNYDYKVKFLATPAMLGNYPTRNLQVRSANPRQNFLVGYEGRDIASHPISCRWNDVGGYYHNSGSVSVWYKLDNSDQDLDGFYPTASDGIDFDDGNDHRFPFAPELLDGIDNNNAGGVDENPMECPASLKAYDTGTCVLDNRMGWYPPSPNTLIERRFRNSSGTYTAWETVGSGLTSYSFVMTSDPAVDRMEVRTTYYPAAGGSYSGVNVIYKAAGWDVPVFPVGPEFQAEDGRIVPPMQVGTSGSDVFVHTPAGSAGIGSASADYRINITATGDYWIWTRVSASTASDDSVFVTLYTATGQPVDFGFGSQAHFRLERANPAYGYAGFAWTRVGHWNPYVTPEQNVNPITYHLTPGVYYLRLQPRELGTKLDKLRVERYCPDADGDGWTVCAGDCNDANASINPAHGEVCGNSYDDDCDGYVNEGCGGGGSPIFKKVVE